MTHLLSFALVATLAMPPLAAAVQFEPEKKISYEEREAAEFATMAQALVGKTFWFEPRPDLAEYSRLKFIESLPSIDTPAYNSFDPPTFRPTGKVAFTVTDLIEFQDPREKWSLPVHYAVITFEGGKVGYLKVPASSVPPFRVYDPKSYYVPEFNELVYLEDPDVIRKRERNAAAAVKQKRIAAKKAWQARGGVLIGMTKQQVLSSNWGKPARINRTTNLGGTSEQWVYEGGNYLYFSNGILTTIQH